MPKLLPDETLLPPPDGTIMLHYPGGHTAVVPGYTKETVLRLIREARARQHDENHLWPKEDRA